ncbi:MAG: imidazole glycerol phosphate synthase subunit HisH, partial [Acidobacteria bacterium]|nr:imidazole glycerol phosphate synthase subunit HisH [Acidobacteriota bacterium]
MAQDVLIADYGSGNLRSLTNALEQCARSDQRVVLSGDPAAVARAERIVLPGVGAFGECRRKLDESGLLPALGAAVAAGKPLFGICVGMQVLASRGLEFGETAGLGWVPGVTRRLRLPETAGESNGDARVPRLKLPHVAWTPVEILDEALFDGIPQGSHFYFVHSYFLECAEPGDIAATAVHGERFTAAVRRDNVFGSQFHPEKSDTPGLRLLENF